MRNKLVFLVLMSTIILSGCIGNSNDNVTPSPTPTPYVPKFHVGDPITDVGRSIYGGKITEITKERYVLDSGNTVSISVADSAWSNTTGNAPKYKVGDYAYQLDDTDERGYVTDVLLDEGRYVINNIVHNSSEKWSIVDGDRLSAKVPTNYTLRFKSGDYVYFTRTMEYEQIVSYSQPNETYTTTKGKFFVLDERYKKLDINNPPNGLYLFKDENTVLRYVYDEFTQKGFYVVQNPKTGEVVQVSSAERRVIVAQDTPKKNGGGGSALPFIAGFIIGKGI